MEFDCIECGQHIVRMLPAENYKGDPLMCAHCMFLPGWFRNPHLRELIAPEGLPNLPQHEKGEAE